MRHSPLEKLSSVAIRMVLENPRLTLSVNRFLMAFPRFHGYLQSIAIRNKLMSGAPDLTAIKPVPAVAGLVPQDPLNCPRRVRAMHKALELGLRDKQGDRR